MKSLSVASRDRLSLRHPAGALQRCIQQEMHHTFQCPLDRTSRVTRESETDETQSARSLGSKVPAHWLKDAGCAIRWPSLHAPLVTQRDGPLMSKHRLVAESMVVQMRMRLTRIKRICWEHGSD